jgi:hypothetical protein
MSVMGQALLVVAGVLLTAQDGIDTLVERLNRDDIAEREEAAEDLVRLGPKAVHVLRKFLEQTSDSEVRARLESVITRIERARRGITCDGGTIVGGLQATLRSKSKSFRAGEAFEFELSIVNTQDDPVSFVPIRSLSHTFPEESIWRQSGQATVTVKRSNGAKGWHTSLDL